ncbi:MAG: hypothetical protein IT497_09630 [Ottowia sp.]|nr:hypothetical protein [Ottowia sp.]
MSGYLKTCYEKNVHRMVHTQPMVNADIANGTITHRLHTEPDVIRDPALELAPFPLLLNCYLKTQYPLPKLLSTLNLGAYQPLFEAALMTRIVKSELKMVSPHHTEELNRIFSPLVQDLFSKRPMLTTAHFQTILDTFKAKNISKQEQAYLLFCLSASFVRYSSKLGFGTDNDSPFVVRSYAAALLHQASMQYPPSSATLPKIEDYQNRLLGIKGSLAFSCTHALFLDMHDHVKKSRDRALQETFDFVIPPIWR